MDKDGGEERINDFIFINKNIKYHWDQQWPMFRSLYVSHSHVMETVQCTRHNTIYYCYLSNYGIFHKKVETLQRNVCCWSLFNQLVVGVRWLLVGAPLCQKGVWQCDSVTVWQCDPTMTGTRTRENRYAGRYQRADWTEDWMLMTRLTWDDRMTPGCWMTTWHTVMPSQCQHTDGASNLNKIIQNYTKADWDLQQLPNTCQPSSPTSQLPSTWPPPQTSNITLYCKDID